jgi:hypothetical protein
VTTTARALTDAPWTRPLEALSAVQPTPSLTLVTGAAVLAGVMVLYRPAWVLLRHVVTIAHEGGHAAVAVLAGRRLNGVRLHSDTSGVTVSRGRPTGIGVVLVLLAGYLAPSVLGLAAALALSRGYVMALLWAVLALLAVLLVQIRNVFGVVSVVVTGAAVFAVSWWAPLSWRAVAAYVLVWFLLLAGPMPVVELQRQRRRRRAGMSDADQLATLTRVPGIVWVAVFLLGTLAAAVLGGRWLLPL